MQKTGDQCIWYTYDESGTLSGLRVGSSEYYYYRNGQGDIIGIIDGTGSIVVKYSYDAWGTPIAITDGAGNDVSGNASHIANINPFRYRGYYYDVETGLYYLQSRYYDSQVGRFVNADGYVSTGQEIYGTNMFVYCGNNSVNRLDPNGQFFETIIEFVKNAIAQTGYAMRELTPAYAGCGGAAIADGPLPVGDIVGVVGAVLLTIGAIGYGTYQATQTQGRQNSKAEEKEKDITIPSKPKRQAYFEVNPYDFNPKGLVMKEYSGTKNGRIIEWRDPISQAKIFEWNEDFKNGSHYHAMMIEWDGNHHGTHYLPGTLVPEPWNSIYFGD